GGTRAIAGDGGRKREIEIAEFNLAGNDRGGLDLREAIVDLRLRLQNIVEPAHGGSSALENIGDPAEGDHRPSQNAQIGVKGNQSAQRNLPPQKLVAALPEHDEKGG